jgi:hypothetical protein
MTKLTIHLREFEGVYIATALGLEDATGEELTGEGPTRDAAIADLKREIKEYLEENEEEIVEIIF